MTHIDPYKYKCCHIRSKGREKRSTCSKKFFTPTRGSINVVPTRKSMNGYRVVRTVKSCSLPRAVSYHQLLVYILISINVVIYAARGIKSMNVYRYLITPTGGQEVAINEIISRVIAYVVVFTGQSGGNNQWFINKPRVLFLSL